MQFSTFSGFDIQPLKWKMYTKSHIPGILNTYWPRSLSVNPLPYYAAASILPMRTNNYVVSQLIDWSVVPDDPIFQLTFPQPGKKIIPGFFNCHTQTFFKTQNIAKNKQHLFQVEVSGMIWRPTGLVLLNYTVLSYSNKILCV